MPAPARTSARSFLRARAPRWCATHVLRCNALAGRLVVLGSYAAVGSLLVEPNARRRVGTTAPELEAAAGSPPRIGSACWAERTDDVVSGHRARYREIIVTLSRHRMCCLVVTIGLEARFDRPQSISVERRRGRLASHRWPE
jgi:hypothetical protein